jgi:hypothetical protein
MTEQATLSAKLAAYLQSLQPVPIALSSMQPAETLWQQGIG